MLTWTRFETLTLAFSVLALVVSAVSRVMVWLTVCHRPMQRRTQAKVGILKPLCGVDASLEENLAAFARQSHEDIEIVFGVARSSDGALPLAVRFCREHADVSVRVDVGEDSAVYNPKLALLSRMSRRCGGDWIVVSDSNVRVGERYVEDALARAAPDVGLITHLVAGTGGASVAAHFENLQLNCFVAPGVCSVRALVGRTCVIGKSMFLRRDVLDEIGGFEAAGSFLAEDYVMGRAIERAGYRVIVARLPVKAWHQGWTLRRFVNRHLRWAVMRRRVSPSAYLAELLLTPAPALSALLAMGLTLPASAVSVSWVAAGLALDQGLDAMTYSRMTGKRIPIAALLLNPLRQWLTLSIWVVGWFVQTVAWRGKSYRVSAGTKLQPLAPLGGRLADEA